MLQSMGQRLSGSRVRKRTTQQGDAGFTLTEVIWALFLLGVVAMGSLMLFLNGMKTVADFQHKQTASSLAASALDRARSVSSTAVSAADTTGVLMGRSETAVLAVWDHAASIDPSYVADMKADWDRAPSASDDEWVPVRITETVGKQTFTVYTLVGTCYRLKTSLNTGQACTQEPTTVDDAELYRVRALVTWDTGDGEVQSYTASTFIDPSADVTWNTALQPYAYDDLYTVFANSGATALPVVSNDAIELQGENPIVNLSLNPTPNHGTLALSGVDSVEFTPDPDVSGTVTFTYAIQNTAGEISATVATVTVHILPSPRNDTGGDDEISVEPGTTTKLNDLLLANDLGVENLSPDRTTVIVPFSDINVDYVSTEEPSEETLQARQDDIAELASRGVTVDASGDVWFEAPTDVGESRHFSYYLADQGTAPGDNTRRLNRDQPADVTITTAAMELDVQEGSYDFTATESPVWHEIDWRDLTGNDNEDVQIRITDLTSGHASAVSIDGTTGLNNTGQELTFRTNRSTNGLGVYVIEYVLVSPGGALSDPETMTMTVTPVAPNRDFTLRHNTDHDLDLLGHALPPEGMQVVDLGSPTCGGLSIRPDGDVQFEAPRLSGGQSRLTCTFTYHVETTGTPTVTSTSPGSVTISVRRS